MHLYHRFTHTRHAHTEVHISAVDFQHHLLLQGPDGLVIFLNMTLSLQA